MRIGFLFAVLLALPGPLGAQAGQDPSTPDPSAGNRVRSTATAVLKASQIADESRVHVGGWVGLVFSESLAVGGGGFALLKNVELAGSEGGTGFNLDMGYGGLFFQYWEPLGSGLTGEVGLLLGAGHAEVQDQLSRTEVGSDNFLVGEGEIGVTYSVFKGVHIGLSLGYRLTSGVEDLPGVSTGDLNAYTGSLSLRLGGG